MCDVRRVYDQNQWWALHGKNEAPILKDKIATPMKLWPHDITPLSYSCDVGGDGAILEAPLVYCFIYEFHLVF